MSLVRADIIVTGIVQGVYYRADTQRQAAALGLTGWVRNEMDGSVGISAEGEKEAIDTLIEWCHEGPPGARVERVEVKWYEPTGQFQQFSIEF
jgi:acylphosphatase